MLPAFEHLYAHFPFCEVICHYCDFYTARAKDARHEDFFEAMMLEQNLALEKLSRPLKAIYLGGGTPSASPPLLMKDFLAGFGAFIDENTEVTMEANPNNISAAALASWKEIGINRISLGVQSLNDSLLKRLGRTHSASAALDALSLAKQFFSNVSGDLIYGVPGQAEAEPAAHALQLAEAGATHISAYHLTIPQTHFLFAQLPADTLAWAQIKALADALSPLGFSHYEVSNLALPGFESKNNSNYWSGGPYFAFGPSAHGFDGHGSRWKNVADWEEYIRRLRAGESPEAERETLTLEQRRIEFLFTALRTNRGLDLPKYAQAFGQNLMQRNGAFLQNLVSEGLATLDNHHFALTFAGRMLTDEIVRKLL